MKKIFFILFFIFSVTVLYSAKTYRILSRGMVLDNSTSLTWTRCALTTGDKPIYDFNCNGEKKLYSWSEAIEVCNNLVHEGRSDWRLPSISELQSIIFYYHYSTGLVNYSQTYESVFPNAVTLDEIQEKDYNAFWGSYCVSNTCYQHYWSSTSLNDGAAWTVNFFSGGTQWDTKVKYKTVRCVAGP